MRRYQYNPRMLDVARRIPRGTIVDRNGLAARHRRPRAAESRGRVYGRLGIAVDSACPDAPAAAIRSAASPSTCSATRRRARTGARRTRRSSSATAKPGFVASTIIQTLVPIVGERRHAQHRTAARLPRSRPALSASVRPGSPGDEGGHGSATRAAAHDRRAAAGARRRDPRRVRPPLRQRARGRRRARSRDRRSARQRQLSVAFPAPSSARTAMPGDAQPRRCWTARAMACIRPARRSS